MHICFLVPAKGLTAADQAPSCNITGSSAYQAACSHPALPVQLSFRAACAAFLSAFCRIDPLHASLPVGAKDSGFFLQKTSHSNFFPVLENF